MEKIYYFYYMIFYEGKYIVYFKDLRMNWIIDLGFFRCVIYGELLKFGIILKIISLEIKFNII